MAGGGGKFSPCYTCGLSLPVPDASIVPCRSFAQRASNIALRLKKKKKSAVRKFLIVLPGGVWCNWEENPNTVSAHGGRADTAGAHRSPAGRARAARAPPPRATRLGVCTDHNVTPSPCSWRRGGTLLRTASRKSSTKVGSRAQKTWSNPV